MDGQPDTGAGVNAEAQTIDGARAALVRGRTSDALHTLMSHERRFPHGQLAEERDVLIIEAYIAAGEPSLARTRLERYRAERPDGVHRARVDAAERRLTQPPARGTSSE
jgi:hypothetical protein